MSVCVENRTLKSEIRRVPMKKVETQRKSRSSKIIRWFEQIVGIVRWCEEHHLLWVIGKLLKIVFKLYVD